MSQFTTHLLRDIKHEFNIYNYFNRNNVWVFETGENMEDITITFYDGDLSVENSTDLPNDIQFLVVKGNFTIKNSLVLRGFYEGEPGALIVTGNLHCKTMELAWGDIAIIGNLSVEQYIFSHDPEFEQGSLDVRGEVSVPYVFKGGDNPSYYFKKDPIFKKVVETEDNPFHFYEKETLETIYSANSYYQFLESKEK